MSDQKYKITLGELVRLTLDAFLRFAQNDKGLVCLRKGGEVIPVMITGATDGKYLRSARIPVYGVSGMFGDADDARANYWLT